ncbi:6-hydroxymethylpterin diphosphokinase MptE-like protein [Marispirochaeta sp.]|uniref:6-hydroxymethylpterin diphosphokinase MptE-like protein n=1 Tax=Marispirochaeta sp. TaxID=2038653 RepID=UPI0029C63A0E|nr:6-hydroxymethylpterin diphosphokinase MptE-like protein [Marispirochaeta sp.]
MLSFDTSRTGDTIPVIRGRALVSRFNPQREAERFIRSAIPKTSQDSGIILIVGDVLGYIAAAAAKEYAQARIVSLSLNHELMPANPPLRTGDIFWSPASGSLDSILTKVLDEEALLHESFDLLEWQPSITAFPGTAAEILEKIQRRVRIINGNITTIKAFGYRWIRNSISNYLYAQEFCRLSDVQGSALVVASGSSLNRSREFIRSSRAILIALPSSLRFLRSLGKIPDMIVQTDPGFYASLHLAEARGVQVPVAAPLFSDSGIRRHTGPFLPLSCGEPFEEALFSLLGLIPLRIPAMGTVAASAIMLSLGLSRAPVMVAGLDLCYDDIHPHVRPHTFDPVFEAAVSRVSPLYSIKYRYSRDTASKPGQSAALKTYSDWFTGLGDDISGRVRRVHPSDIELPFPTLSATEARDSQVPAGALSFIKTAAPSFKIRKERLQQLLADIRRSINTEPSSPLVKELQIKLSPPVRELNAATYTSEKIGDLQDLLSDMEAP